MGGLGRRPPRVVVAPPRQRCRRAVVEGHPGGRCRARTARGRDRGLRRAGAGSRPARRRPRRRRGAAGQRPRRSGVRRRAPRRPSTRCSTSWPLSPGDRVGVAASEWGPNLETFAHRGLVPVPLPVDADGVLDLEALEGQLVSDPPDLVHVDLVAAQRGLVQPAAEVLALARSHGVPVWLDAAQAVGHVAVPPGAAAVYATSRKWLTGPRGVGMLAVAPEHRPALRLRRLAKHPDLPDVHHLESDEAHVAGRVGLGVAVREHLGLGPERVHGRLARGRPARAREPWPPSRVGRSCTRRPPPARRPRWCRPLGRTSPPSGNDCSASTACSPASACRGGRRWRWGPPVRRALPAAEPARRPHRGRPSSGSVGPSSRSEVAGDPAPGWACRCRVPVWNAVRRGRPDGRPAPTRGCLGSRSGPGGVDDRSEAGRHVRPRARGRSGR